MDSWFSSRGRCSRVKPIAALAGMTLTAAARVSRDGMGPEVRAYTPGDSLRRSMARNGQRAWHADENQ